MGRRNGDLAGWKWAVLGVFGGVVLVGSVQGLLSSPVATKEFFASLAGLALFLPITVMAVTHIPAIERRLGGAASASTPATASVLLGCVSLAFAAGAISGAYGYFVDGVTEFETGRHYRFMMPVPVFIAVSAVVAVLLGALSIAAWRHRIKGRRR